MVWRVFEFMSEMADSLVIYPLRICHEPTLCASNYPNNNVSPYPFPMILLEFWARDGAGFSTLVRRRELTLSKEKQGMKKPLQIGGQKPGKSSGMGILSNSFKTWCL